MIESISAITLATHDMPGAVRFYRALGFEILHGGEDSSFTSFRAGPKLSQPHRPATRATLVVVGARDLLRQRCRCASPARARGGIPAEHFTTRCRMGERFFHIDDPDGHELSFARPLRPPM